MAKRVEDDMVALGCKFIYQATPTEVELASEGDQRIVYYQQNGETKSDLYDTVMFAIGRSPVTSELKLENIGLRTDKNDLVIIDKYLKTDVENVYAIGDVVYGFPQLTPTAKMAGKILAKRLYGGSSLTMDFEYVPMCVFGTLEYGFMGYTEEDAETKYKDNVEIFHTCFTPLEWEYDHDNRKHRTCYIKVIVKKDDDRVIGIHLFCPQAGEIVSSIAIAMRCGMTKSMLDDCVGIHPTKAEEITDLEITKRINPNPIKTAC